MARLKEVRIENYRSISDPITICFPCNQPVVFIGENNAGKSNIIRAIDLLFGEYWPGSRKLENHEHWQRNPNNSVVIEADVRGFTTQLKDPQNNWHFSSISGLKWESSNSGTGEPNFSAICQSTGHEVNVNKELRTEISSLIVNADQNLSYQLSYASKWTLLSKVMRSFHDRLVSDDERVTRLKDVFENLKSIFLEVPEFREFEEKMSSIAGEMLANMSHILELDFSAYDPSNYFRSLRVSPSEFGEARSIEELGTGQQQILALSFAHAYCKSFLSESLILIIDEPETHLHPLAQKWLSRVVSKMAQDGLQIIVTTHSSHFIDLNFIEGIHLVRKDQDGTIIINHDKQALYDYCNNTGARAELATVVPFYANNAIPRILDGFFARKLLLVEGLTEELALPEYFRKAGLDIEREGIDIIGVQGKGNLAKWWRLFTLFQIPTFICFDNDGKSDGDGKKRKDALKSIGIPEGELEEILTHADWNISDRFCAFGKDFEETMRNSFSKYKNVEEKVKSELGRNSKHIVARETAKRLPYDESLKGWKKIGSIVSKIRSLGATQYTVPQHNIEDE